jgi:TrmH family RNA methyltransferase
LERRAVNALRHIVNGEVGKQTADWDFVDGEGRLSAEKRTVLPGVRVYLEDIRSPYNVGSIFRAAESFGAERLYLSPLCASPEHPRAARSSMGCSLLVPWERARLEETGGPYFALETGGTFLDEFPFPENGVLIVGSEELGVSPEALALAEASLGRVSIPTIGAKGSLNVSVAFGIAMREWCSRLT